MPPISRTTIAAAALAILVTLAVYAQTVHFDYVSWDDPNNIVNNPHLNRKGGPDFDFYWNHTYLFVYRPLIYTLWSAIASVSRLPHPIHAPGLGDVNFDPHAFHLVNLLLHCANTFLVFVILRRLVKRDWPALAGAVLFSVHPLQTESVAWITAGNELLFGFFALLAILQYVKYAESPEAPGREANPGRQLWHYFWAFVCFMLAVFSKPTAVSVALLLWGLDVFGLRRPWKQVTLGLIPWILAGAVMVAVASVARQVAAINVVSPYWGRPFVAGDTLAFFLYKLLAPVGLAIDYGRTPSYVLDHPWGFMTWLVPVAVCVLVWRSRKNAPLLAGAVALFVLGLVPVLGLLINPFQLYSTAADRYVYLPMLGPALAAACLTSRIRPGQSQSAAQIAGVAVVLIGLTVLNGVSHVPDFRDSVALYKHTSAANPASWTSFMNLGVYYKDAGDLDAAQTNLEQTLRLEPNFPSAHMDLALVLEQKGDIDGALAQIRAAMPYAANDPAYHYKLALLLSRKALYDEAMTEYQTALQLSPNNGEYEYNEGSAQIAMHKLDAAVATLRRALLDRAPNPEKAHNQIGVALAQQNQTDAAVAEWRMAIAINPNYPDPHYNIGAALTQQHRAQEANAEYRAALQIDPNYTRARQALGL